MSVGIQGKGGLVTGGSRGVGLATAPIQAAGAGLAGIGYLLGEQIRGSGFHRGPGSGGSRAGVRVYALCPGKVATDMPILYAGARVGIPPERVAERVLAVATGKGAAAGGSCITVS